MTMNAEVFGQTFYIMLWGMLGGLLVMALLCGVLMLLYAVGKKK